MILLTFFSSPVKRRTRTLTSYAPTSAVIPPPAAKWIENYRTKDLNDFLNAESSTKVLKPHISQTQYLNKKAMMVFNANQIKWLRVSIMAYICVIILKGTVLSYNKFMGI